MNDGYFRALSIGIKSTCRNIKLNDADSLKNTQKVAEEPVQPVCDIDMDSNEWTFVQKDYSEKIFFDGDAIRIISDISEDVGSATSCQELIIIAILNKKPQDIQCEGSIAKAHYEDTLKFDTKEEFQKIKEGLYKSREKECPTDESTTEPLFFQGEPPISAKCSIDVDSDLWTVEFEDVHEVVTYEFKGNVTKVTREKTKNFGTPKDCTDSASTRTANGEKIRCVGTIAFETLEESENEGLTKENVMSQLKYHYRQ